MATIARLNKVASQTPQSIRKRPRTSDLQDPTPQKRRAIQDDNQQRRSIETRSTASRSATRLRTRSSLPAPTPIPKPRAEDVFQFQEDSGREGSPQTPQEARLVVKKKRKLNQKELRRSGRPRKFDERLVNTINPATRKSIITSSFDSPAKNTRARRENPLKKLDQNRYRPVSLDAVQATQPSTLPGTDSEQESLPTSGQPNKEPNEVDVEDNAEETDHNDEAPKSNQDAAGDGTDQSERESEVVVRPQNAGSELPDIQDIFSQGITEVDRNFMVREQEKQERQRQQASEARQEETASKNATKSPKKKARPPEVQSRNGRGNTQTDDQTDAEEDEEEDEAGPSRTQVGPKRKRRPKISEAEKLAKKEAAVRKRQENAEVSEKAAIEKFDARAKKSIDGIEDLAAQIGGIATWHKLGAGALTITGKAQKNKDKLEGVRAQNLWRRLVELKDIFSSNEEADEERVSHLINNLKVKATWDFLTKSGTTNKDGDSTILDLYEHLIPQSVYVLQEGLRERFVAAHKISWQELQTLTEIPSNFCRIAMNWTPRPSALDAAIRQQVRQNVRPSLAIILNNIKDVVKRMEWEEKRMREHAAFTRRQQLKKKEKEIEWQKMFPGRFPSETARATGYASSYRSSHRAVSDNEAEEVHVPVQQPQTIDLTNEDPPNLSLRRQQTEEIPAPDPNTTWTEKENVALLNGLQKYLDKDRYAMIVDDPKFARALRDKDVDQCMARARFYQAGCSQILKEQAEAGDDSFDWLRTV